MVVRGHGKKKHHEYISANTTKTRKKKNQFVFKVDGWKWWFLIISHVKWEVKGGGAAYYFWKNARGN